MQETRSIELRTPDYVAYANVTNNSTDRTNNSLVAAPSEYQDLHLRYPENAGEYQELVPESKTGAELVMNMPDITYENTKVEGQNKSKPEAEGEQRQYEELKTKHDEHTYSVSIEYQLDK